MVLLLETAELLEGRARRCGDPVRVAVLLRRAEHRRRQAGELREKLGASGTALPPGRAVLPGTARSSPSCPTGAQPWTPRPT